MASVTCPAPQALYLSERVQLFQDGVFVLLREASCQQLIYLLQKEEWS